MTASGYWALLQTETYVLTLVLNQTQQKLSSLTCASGVKKKICEELYTVEGKIIINNIIIIYIYFFHLYIIWHITTVDSKFMFKFL